MSKVFRKSVICIAVVLATTNAAIAKSINSGDLSNVNIPSVFKDLLSSGMPIVAKVKYIGNKSEDAKLEGVIEGNIFLKNNELVLSYVDVKDDKVFFK
ncbi:hypothetical protein IHC92_18985 [Photobacterium damselae subsp. damselae]|uniref:hypothetical protein n=1 Tax=Photobacterium damselae TaxID=38293 RepID=UPI001F3EBC39|nr:hypothetical protein [Photobacterium damselae]UKA23053.1 hypothetical protein IHC92_18985 [Photobacterium damselae subsp. damselae]